MFAGADSGGRRLWARGSSLARSGQPGARAGGLRFSKGLADRLKWLGRLAQRRETRLPSPGAWIEAAKTDGLRRFGNEAFKWR